MRFINLTLVYCLLAFSLVGCGSKGGSEPTSADQKTLNNLIDIEVDDQITSMAKGDQYHVKLVPSKSVKIKVEIEGFIIRTNNIFAKTETLNTELHEEEDWTFIAHKSNNYKIKITAMDENESREILNKTFSSDNVTKNPNQGLIEKMKLDGDKYFIKNNGIKVYFEKSFIEGNLSDTNIYVHSDSIFDISINSKMTTLKSNDIPPSIEAFTVNTDPYQLNVIFQREENIVSLELFITIKDIDGNTLLDFNPLIYNNK